MTEHHRIRRQVLELHIQDQAQAWPLQTAASRIHEQQLAAVIERCCSEIGDPRRVHRIDLLEVDLGAIDPDHVERDLVAKLGPAMAQTLARRIRRDDEEDALAGRDPDADSQLELVAHVARHGHLPWWADASRRSLVDDAAALLLRRAPASLVMLVRGLASQRAALVRLVAACADDRLSALLSLLLAESGLDLPDRSDALQALLRTAWAVPEATPARFRAAVWIGALRTSIAEVGAGGAIGFWREAIARAAGELGLTYRALIDRLDRLDRVGQDDRGQVHVAHVEIAGGGQPDSLTEIVRVLLHEMRDATLPNNRLAREATVVAAIVDETKSAVAADAPAVTAIDTNGDEKVMQVLLHEMRGGTLANEQLTPEDVPPREAVTLPAAAPNAVERHRLTATAAERHDAVGTNAVAADARAVAAGDASGDAPAANAVAADAATVMLAALLAELASLDRPRLRDLLRELDRASPGRPLNEVMQVLLHEMRGSMLAGERLVREDVPPRAAVIPPAAAVSAAKPDTLTSTATERHDAAVANVVAAGATAVTAIDASSDEGSVANDPVTDANVDTVDANADTTEANAETVTAMLKALLAELASFDRPQLRDLVRELDRAWPHRDESSTTPASGGEADAARARAVDPSLQTDRSGEPHADANDAPQSSCMDGGSPRSRDEDLDSATDARPRRPDEDPDAARGAPGAHTRARTTSDLEIVLQRLARPEVPLRGVFVGLRSVAHAASGEQQRALLRVLQDIDREATGGLSALQMAVRLLHAIRSLLEPRAPGMDAARLDSPAPRGQLSTTQARSEMPRAAGVPLADQLIIPRARARRAPPAPVRLFDIDPDEAYVQNAGLVVLWPFLRRLFERLELVADKQFVSDTARGRAVGLLQHLATSDREPVEHDLPLAKVLCGLEPADLVEFGVPVTDREAEECTRLVSAAIAHAPILGDMSISGFRTAFVVRNGAVTTRDGAWLLRVERVPHDVVLDLLPWSFSWIKLPWMEIPLGVEW